MYFWDCTNTHAFAYRIVIYNQHCYVDSILLTYFCSCFTAEEWFGNAKSNVYSKLQRTRIHNKIGKSIVQIESKYTYAVTSNLLFFPFKYIYTYMCVSTIYLRVLKGWMKIFKLMPNGCQPCIKNNHIDKCTAYKYIESIFIEKYKLWFTEWCVRIHN